MRIHSLEFYARVARNGSVGAGEAYMDGLWACDDLVTLVRILVRNRDLLDAMESGMARVGGAVMRAVHALGRKTRQGSRRNISAHYDLGNALFELFLDDNMMYSSAIFAREGEKLETASGASSIASRKLDLGPTITHRDRRGWGGFALPAGSAPVAA